MESLVNLLTPLSTFWVVEGFTLDVGVEREGLDGVGIEAVFLGLFETIR